MRRLEQARIDELFNDADDLKKADAIRRFVADIRIRLQAVEGGHDVRRVKKWPEWALAQANSIDPLRSGRFMEEVGEERMS